MLRGETLWFLATALTVAALWAALWMNPGFILVAFLGVGLQALAVEVHL